MISCCSSNNKTKKCIRKKDKKIFKLPRRFTKKKCLKGIKGFTMRSSCAPYKYCKGGKNKTKKQFLYNPNNPKKSFDVYIDKNPNDTISIKYTTVNDVKNTIKKLENLYKQDKYSHKRIWQVAMIMKVRLESIQKHKKKNSKIKNISKRVKLSQNYFKFLGERTKKNKEDRKKMIFNTQI